MLCHAFALLAAGRDSTRCSGDRAGHDIVHRRLPACATRPHPSPRIHGRADRSSCAPRCVMFPLSLLQVAWEPRPNIFGPAPTEHPGHVPPAEPATRDAARNAARTRPVDSFDAFDLVRLVRLVRRVRRVRRVRLARPAQRQCDARLGVAQQRPQRHGTRPCSTPDDETVHTDQQQAVRAAG